MRTEIGFWACIINANLCGVAGMGGAYVLAWAGAALLLRAPDWIEALRRRKD
jgi:hypothetical protein